jgi:outer membrane protein OmpA-like peptidoglycan-associated protein
MRARAASLIVAAFLSVSAAHGQQPPAAQDVNLLSFANGALVERVSSDYGGDWGSYMLLTEDPHKGWANGDGGKPPFDVVLSFPERSEIHRFVFNTASAESPQRAVKSLGIEISEDGKTFKPVMTVDLKAETDDQQFTPPAPAAGRYLKFIVRSNHGDKDYWEILGTRAFGVELTSTPLKNVSGTYTSHEYGKFHLLQQGAQLSGCYEFNEGLVQGGLERHAMRLTWTESEGKRHGPAIMVATRDGKGFKGFWHADGEDRWTLDWDLKKVSDAVGSCPHWKPKTANANLVEQGLATQQRVRLYGINFDTDSDHLRADAAATVGQLIAALKGHADWKVAVEGYTDSTGSADHNRELSDRRAAAVKAALVAGGIAAGRLTSSGFGADKPVATNDTEIGRAQNRRVEVVRQ